MEFLDCGKEEGAYLRRASLLGVEYISWYDGETGCTSYTRGK